MPIRGLILALSCIMSVRALQLPSFLRSRLPKVLGGERWYSSGLKFECTGCGKCCKQDGDVWLAPEEARAIAQHLNMDNQAFEDLYTRSIAGPPSDRWLSLVRGVGSNPVLGALLSPSSAVLPADNVVPDHGCVFLDPFGQCSIYEVRPVQCRTYPFWPSLLESKEDWDDEAVLPDDTLLQKTTASPALAVTDFSSDNGSSSTDNSGGYSAAASANRYWSLEEGGCEGIGVATADFVDEAEIERKRKLALRHWRRFPDEEIKETTWYL